MDAQLVGLIGAFVDRGWQGLITLYVAWAVIKQFRAWKIERNGEHNPSKEFHDALEPLDSRLTRIEQTVMKVDRRVARIEGHLDMDGRS